MLAQYGPRAGLAGGGASDPKAIDCEGHRRQFDDFIGAIRSGGEPYCDGVQGREAVAVITAIYRSARDGVTVHIA